MGTVCPAIRTSAAAQRVQPSCRAADGFALSEVLVAIAIIGTISAAILPFLANSMAVVGYEQTRQVAIQVAGDAIDRALALDPRGLVAGHGELKTLAQWNAAPAATRRYLNALQPAFDTDPRLPSDAGDAAPLPTAAIPVDVDGVHYLQRWYVGRCVQQGGAGPRERPCERPDRADSAPTRPDVPLLVVVVTVAWQHNSCPAKQCLYATATMASGADDPAFKAPGEN